MPDTPEQFGRELSPTRVADLVGREPTRAAHLVRQSVGAFPGELEAHLGIVVVNHGFSFRSSVRSFVNKTSRR
jgi:hypothetical protein